MARADQHALLGPHQITNAHEQRGHGRNEQADSHGVHGLASIFKATGYRELTLYEVCFGYEIAGSIIPTAPWAQPRCRGVETKNPVAGRATA